MIGSSDNSGGVASGWGSVEQDVAGQISLYAIPARSQYSMLQGYSHNNFIALWCDSHLTVSKWTAKG